VTSGTFDSSLQQLDPLAIRFEPRARHRIERAHLTFDLPGAGRPVDPRLGLVDLLGITDANLRLRLWRCRDIKPSCQGKSAKFRKLVSELTGTLPINPRDHLEQYRAGVEPFLHPHEGNARHLIARQDRALDGGSSAPAGQERGMHIDAAGLGRLQDRLRQDQPVGRHYRQIGIERPEPCLFVLVAQRPRRPHWNPELLGPLVHRGFALCLAAPRWPRRLAIGRDHLMARLHERVEARHREVRRSHEDDAQLNNLRSP
jgi:hypothetical protein